MCHKMLDFIKNNIDDVAFNYNVDCRSTPITVTMTSKAIRNFVSEIYRHKRTTYGAILTPCLSERLYYIRDRLRNAGKAYKDRHSNAFTRVTSLRFRTPIIQDFNSR